jgi:pimeloyl-ACP methyl ester carboxylesterase
MARRDEGSVCTERNPSPGSNVASLRSRHPLPQGERVTEFVALMGKTMRILMLITGFVLLALVVAGAVFIAMTWVPDRSVAELRPRWGAPPSVFLDIDGMQVHVRDEGPRDDKSPIVLLHGFGSSLHAWEGWAEALRDKRRVVRLDLPGFGLTGPSPDGVYGLDRDMRVTLAVLDQLGIARCVLGGNSLGGAVSWRTALAHPARVEKLILVDSGGYPRHSTSVPIGMRLLRVPGLPFLMQHTLPRFLVEQGMRNVFGDPSRVTPEMVERSFELTAREGNRRAILDRARQRSTTTSFERIRELTLPTLIIWGGRDRLIPPDDAERFHRDITGSVLAVFDDLGHAPEEEDPVRTVAAVKRFLHPASR